MVARVKSSLVSVSPGPDGERVSVVGEDAPSGPDLLAFVAFEPGSVQAVAAFEVADPAFRAGSVALHSSLGALGAGLLTARNEHPVRVEVFECLAGRADVEPTVQPDLLRPDPEPIELRDRVGQQRVLSRVPDPRRRGKDQPSRTTAGVLGGLRDLRHVPKFVALCRYLHSRTSWDTWPCPTARPSSSSKSSPNATNAAA